MARKLISPPTRRVRRKISSGVDGGLSGGSSVRRPGREEPQAPAEIIQCLCHILNVSYTIHALCYIPWKQVVVCCKPYICISAPYTLYKPYTLYTTGNISQNLPVHTVPHVS